MHCLAHRYSPVTPSARTVSTSTERIVALDMLAACRCCPVCLMADSCAACVPLNCRCRLQCCKDCAEVQLLPPVEELLIQLDTPKQLFSIHYSGQGISCHAGKAGQVAWLCETHL